MEEKVSMLTLQNRFELIKDDFIEYKQVEFDEPIGEIKNDFPKEYEDYKTIPLGYTELGNMNQYPCQVYLNLVDLQLEIGNPFCIDVKDEYGETYEEAIIRNTIENNGECPRLNKDEPIYIKKYNTFDDMYKYMPFDFDYYIRLYLSLIPEEDQ